jgi:hypothetical protein
MHALIVMKVAAYNEPMTSASQQLSGLERDLTGIFAERLQSLVAYGLRRSKVPGPHGSGHDEAAARTTALAIVASLREPDLRACTEHVAAWRTAGLATPLLLASGDFERSLDAFPLEFGAIIADYQVVKGADPFKGLVIDPSDLRRACEMQARSHLLHLRQGFLETEGNPNGLAMLTLRSAGPFAALLTSIGRLQGVVIDDPAAAGRHAERALQLSPGTVTDVVRLADASDLSAADAARIFPPYLDATERLVQYVDEWRLA